MFSSLSSLSSSVSVSSSSTSSAPTEILSADQSQSLEEKIPLTSKEEVEKKLASIQFQWKALKTNPICLELGKNTLQNAKDLSDDLSIQNATGI